MPDEAIEVPIPKPEELTVDQKISLATEMAYDELIIRASGLGLRVAPAIGLEYLPDPVATIAFKYGCRKVFSVLGVKWEQDRDQVAKPSEA